MVCKVAEKHQLTLAEISLRWLSHHSVLKRENDDAIIVGASSSNHIGQVRTLLFVFGFDFPRLIRGRASTQNLKDFEKGPLPEDVIAA